MSFTYFVKTLDTTCGTVLWKKYDYVALDSKWRQFSFIFCSDYVCLEYSNNFRFKNVKSFIICKNIIRLFLYFKLIFLLKTMLFLQLYCFVNFVTKSAAICSKVLCFLIRNFFSHFTEICRYVLIQHIVRTGVNLRTNQKISADCSDFVVFQYKCL